VDIFSVLLFIAKPSLELTPSLAAGTLVFALAGNTRAFNQAQSFKCTFSRDHYRISSGR
jgi:hypothetical protein